MDEEYYSLIENGTWDLVNRRVLPPGNGVIGCKWVYKVKRNADNTTRFKAKVVIKGFQQIEGVDYDESYPPVPKFVTFRMLMALAAVQDFEIDQMDVITAFLHPELDKEVYMEQPEKAYMKSNVMVCRLKKALYELKHASRIWHITYVTH